MDAFQISGIGVRQFLLDGQKGYNHYNRIGCGGANCGGGNSVKEDNDCGSGRHE